jgi:hypothetical protein
MHTQRNNYCAFARILPLVFAFGASGVKVDGINDVCSDVCLALVCLGDDITGSPHAVAWLVEESL